MFPFCKTIRHTYTPDALPVNLANREWVQTHLSELVSQVRGRFSALFEPLSRPDTFISGQGLPAALSGRPSRVFAPLDSSDSLTGRQGLFAFELAIARLKGEQNEGAKVLLTRSTASRSGIHFVHLRDRLAESPPI